MTVLEVIRRSAEFLEKKGVDSPRLQAELLLAHVLKLPRMQLYLNFERELTAVDLDTSRELVKRRGRREPLQQILGATSFCGLDIKLSHAVLVPRPETELLAEQGWTHLAQLSKSEPPMALDFGTGSGCLAIALAVRCHAARVEAIDVSAEAVELAKQNASNNGVAERIEFRTGRGLTVLAPDARFDLIISNPPYIPSHEIQELQPEVRDYEPRAALDGGADGLDFYRLLAVQAGGLLNPNGKIMLEFGDDQAVSVRELFLEQNWIVERVLEDYTQRPRILIAAHG